MGLAGELAAAGVRRGVPLALTLPPAGVALAWRGGERVAATADPAAVVAELAPLEPRWTWWSASETAAPLVAGGVRLGSCWDLGAVGRLAGGLRRDDPAAVWAAAYDAPEPPRLGRGLDLLDLDGEDGAAVRADGQLSREWAAGGWVTDPGRARRWAALALRLQGRQEAAPRARPDPRPDPRQPPLAVLTAYAESSAALLAVELEATGLPLDRAAAAELLRRLIGDRPADAAAEAAWRAARDQHVLERFPGPPVDLRSPQQVRGLLARIGLDLPDTRSWRLEPHAATSDAVAALLTWRKAERIATTYGWEWLDRQVDTGGRLRGRWAAADGAAGRMTAQAGLHNLPGELRPAVRAERGRVLVRADLGQVEPRVLAAVSGDAALAAATRADDLYAPVAAQLRCDRPTAKVAVLAAMYGQTSGTAGAALRDLDRAYPQAMAYLRAAEEVGRVGGELTTYGGRLLRLPAGAPGAPRFARNAVVQGAAAELFKAWAATVRAGLGGLDGEIVLCLHDELLLHVVTEQAERARAVLLGALADTAHWWAAGSGVRFVADVAVGADWASAR